jgi:hypothetical protein
LAGAIIGNHLGGQWGLTTGARSGFSAIAGFAALAITVLFVRKKGNQLGHQNQYRPRITRILRTLPTTTHMPQGCMTASPPQGPAIHG